MTYIDQTKQPRGAHGKHVAFVLLGLATFLLSNGLWAEMAALIDNLPEAERLGSYMIVFLQCGNVVPLAVMWYGDRVRLLRLESCLWLILLWGFVTSILITFLWDSTAEVGGAQHSLALLMLTFLAGCSNNVSSLAFYAFVARFPGHFVSSLATGEGMSGVVVALLALIQDVGGRNRRFSVSAYFGLITIFYSLSCAAFVYLQRAEEQQTALASPETEAPIYTQLEEHGTLETPGTAIYAAADCNLPLSETKHVVSPVLPQQTYRCILPRIWQPILTQILISALAFGVMPSILPVAATSYLHGRHVLQYASLVSMIMDPLSRALTHLCHCHRLPLLTIIVLSLGSLLISCASLSPRPPLSAKPAGGLLIIIANGALTASFAFTSTMCYFAIRRILTAPHTAHRPLSAKDGMPDSMTQLQSLARGYKWSAFAIQIGAFVGSIVSFVTFAVER